MASLPEGEPEAVEPQQDAPTLLGPDTAKYLDDKATESFKRQVDLEESIWRSLPLITGALIAAAAMIAKTASALPMPIPRFFPLCAYVALAAAVVFFGVAFWWLWQIVRPREYDFPADDAAIAEYATNLAAFYASFGMEDEALDKAVMADLRAYSTASVGKAAKSTFNNNQARLSARGQVLVWLLWGFMLSFTAEAVIYGHSVIYGKQRGEATPHGNEAPNIQSPPKAAPLPAASGSPADAGHSRRGVVNEDKHVRANSGKVNE